jgi:hypothetical protein
LDQAYLLFQINFTADRSSSYLVAKFFEDGLRFLNTPGMSVSQLTPILPDDRADWNN